MNTWINGRAARMLDVRDRGLQYGDGLFETMRVRRRTIRFMDYHLERLDEGCRRLTIAVPDFAVLRRELLRVATLRPQAVVKLIVTRGRGTRGYRPDGRERTTRIMSLHPLTPQVSRVAEPPARLRLCATRLCVSETLAGLKTTNRLDSILARSEWADARVWEGLMRDSDDNIVCGTMSNLFLRRGGELVTPRLDRCGIAGIMRRWVLEQTAALGLRPHERRIRWRDLARSDEAFMTNAIVGVVPVASIVDGRERIRFTQHRTADELRQRLERL